MTEEKNNASGQREDLRRAVRERTIGYIVGAFGLVAGLAWNDAVKALIEFVFPIQENTLSAKFIYAVIVTIITVMFTVYLSRVFRDHDE